MEDFSRRHFVMLGMGLFVAGCAKNRSTGTSSLLPSAPWDEGDDRLAARPEPHIDENAKVIARTTPTTSTPTTAPTTLPLKPEPGPMPGVLPRSSWAKGGIIASRMEPMLPVSRITVHHSAMMFAGNNRAAAAYELERIRASHTGSRGFGDIGYHFIIDRNGQVWEGRSLKWQGAHVKSQNEGNIGVMCMGNFDVQSPTSAQQQALIRHVRALMSKYRVPVSRVKTHKEMAATACPGVSLQRYMLAARRSGGSLA